MNNRAWMIGLLVLMAIVCSTALAIVNIVTSPVIERNEEIKYMSTVLDVFEVSYDSENSESIIATYKERITEETKEELTLFYEKKSGAIAVSLDGSGFQGHISLVVALEGDTISGFKVVSQNETPGLGARITEEPFQKSFVGKKVSDGISMTRSGSAGQQEFDAITGATETSRALEKILTKGFRRYFEVTGEK